MFRYLLLSCVVKSHLATFIYFKLAGIGTISPIYLALQNPAGFHLHNKISDYGANIWTAVQKLQRQSIGDSGKLFYSFPQFQLFGFCFCVRLCLCPYAQISQ